MSMSARPAGQPPTDVPHEHRGMLFDTPASWDEEAATVVTAPGRLPQPNIAVSTKKVAANVTVENYAAQRIAATASEMPCFEVKDAEQIAIAGTRGSLYSLVWEIPTGAFMQILVMFKHGDTMFTICASGMASQADVIGPVFDQVLKTFRVDTSRK